VGLHLHMALGGFPTRLDEDAIRERFTNAARHTLGVWQEIDIAPIRGNWAHYITRDLRLHNDELFLVQRITKGVQPSLKTSAA